MRDDSSDKEIETMIAESKQLALNAPCMTWVCYKAGVKHNDVFPLKQEQGTVPTGPTDRGGTVGLLEDWIHQKPESAAHDGKAFPINP